MSLISTGRKNGKRLMEFIITPLAFVLIALILFYLAFGDVLGYAGMVFLNEPPRMDEQMGNIFIPADENVSSVDIAQVEFPQYETVYGQIQIDSVGIDCPLIYGDSDKALKQGACQYIGSFIIGYGGTTLVAAHNNRHFKNLPSVKEGDTIKVTTSYGVYRYRVVATAVKSDSDATAYDLAREDENLILYTCFFENTPVGSVKKRFYVYGDYLSGPMIQQ